MMYRNSGTFLSSGFFLVPLLLVLTLSTPLAHDDATVLSGTGSARVDGRIESHEWAFAQTYPFLINLTIPEGNTSRNGTLWVMNDLGNLYVAGFFPKLLPDTTIVNIEFDNDHDGIREDGDDILLLVAPSAFQDRVRLESAPCPAGFVCNWNDVQAGGTEEGEGKFRHSLGSRFMTMEMSHPLNSDDLGNDFHVAPGDILGFTLRFTRCISGFPCALTDLFGNASRPVGDIRITDFQPDPRGKGFWKHQCGDKGFQQVPRDDMEDWFRHINRQSRAISGCLYDVMSCNLLEKEPPNNQMKRKAIRELASLWLNRASLRILGGNPVDFPHLSSASTVEEAILDIENTLCLPTSRRADLERVRDLAMAINESGNDIDMVGEEAFRVVGPGERVQLSLGLIHFGDEIRDFEIDANGSWPVTVSPAFIPSLEPNEPVELSVLLDVPPFATEGLWSQLTLKSREIGGEGFSEDILKYHFIVADPETGGHEDPNDGDQGIPLPDMKE